MADIISGTLLAKIISGISGLVGGVAFMAFYTPRNVWDAAIRSGLSVTAAIVFTPTIVDWLNVDVSMNNVIACSVAIGFCAWSTVSLVARTLLRIQDEKTFLKVPFISHHKK